jgi:GGDEF domain-containing protein
MRNAQETIRLLSTDKAFGILTRNAIDLAIEDRDKPFNILFVDFNNVHNLNKILGYKRVNAIFREIFEEYKHAHPFDLLGRYFSGDEIVIISNTDGDSLSRFSSLKSISDKHNMSFKSMTFLNQTSIEDII